MEYQSGKRTPLINGLKIIQSNQTRERRTKMKYLQLPCNWFEQPIIRQAIRKDEGFGFKVLANLILKIGNEFQMGDWVRSGFDHDQVPFGYDMTIADWKSTCMVKDDEDKKFWELLSECARLGLCVFKKSEYSMTIIFPQVADMQDETNRKKTKEIFGNPRLSADEMKEIAERISGNILEQTRLEDTKLNSGLVDKDNNNNILTNTSSPHPQGKGSDDDIHTMNINGKKVDVMEYIANHKKAEEEFKH